MALARRIDRWPVLERFMTDDRSIHPDVPAVERQPDGGNAAAPATAGWAAARLHDRPTNAN